MQRSEPPCADTTCYPSCYRNDKRAAHRSGQPVGKPRAKFLLFNRQFDSRLRELVERHRGGHADPDGPGRDAERRPPTREERIESLERRIAQRQRELEELLADSD
ncbi:MAG: hypothetical protein ACRELU_13000 [Gemmatimonadota bacterium]